jgi:hypothetical protein
MGTTKEAKLWINTKKLRNRKITCMDEMTALLACFKKCNFEDDARCAGEKRALDACLSFAAKQPKKANTINYHLQRLSRMAKR